MIADVITPVTEFEGGPKPIAYACKGHREPAEFVQELAAEYDVDITVEQVVHAYWRNVPVGPGSSGMLYQPARGPGRGAYAVTFVDMAARQPAPPSHP
jgi:hypothetical protein